jgi:hypothetical protein
VKPDELDRRFDYHAPDRYREAKHQLIRAVFKDTAGIIERELPEGREKSLVLTKLEEAMFWANAAIARDSSVEPTP